MKRKKVKKQMRKKSLKLLQANITRKITKKENVNGTVN